MECTDYTDRINYTGAFTTYETLLLKKHFNANVDLSYTFCLKPIGVKELTAGLTLYNIFSSKYDTTGWAAPQFDATPNGLKAVNAWGIRDEGAAGFAPSAPFNMMAHLSVNF